MGGPRSFVLPRPFRLEVVSKCLSLFSCLPGWPLGVVKECCCCGGCGGSILSGPVVVFVLVVIVVVVAVVL